MKENNYRKVYFVRHGQTIANIKGTTQGPDDPLDDIGIKQSEFLAKRTKNLDFDLIISSDYDRAKSTAEMIRRVTNKPLKHSTYFREYRRPSEFWSKKPNDSQTIIEGWKQIHANFGKNWHYSDEESFFDLKERGIQALRFLEKSEFETILVVTHGNFLRTLLGLMIKGEKYDHNDYLDIESSFKIFNTSISVAEYTDHWRYNKHTWKISSWNDKAHLGET